MLLLAAGQFCEDTARIWGLIGNLVLVLKIVIPLLLIVLGMVDLGKAVVSNDEKAMNKAVSTLLKRFIAAVIVFFVPTIVSGLFNALSVTDLVKEANQCIQCVVNVNGKNVKCDTGVGI